MLSGVVLVVVLLLILTVFVVAPSPEWWSAFGSILTGSGAVLIIWQIRQRSDQFTKEFEDGLTKEYREIVDDAPTLAFLGERIDNTEFEGFDENDGEFHDAVYRYLDLTNQQIHLRRDGRVSRSTWEDWDEGIREHLKQPEVARTFHNVNKIIDENYTLKTANHFEGISQYLNTLDSPIRDPKARERSLSDIEGHYAFFKSRDQTDVIITNSMDNSEWASCEWAHRASWSNKVDFDTDDSD
jgi:hypothetical protein